MNDRTELYPCGVRVSVPSLGINSTGLNNRRTIIRPHSGRVTSLHDSPVLSYKRVSSIVRSNTMPQIMFSDDIIETMCPETITYDKAREKMRRLWNLRTDRYDLAKKKRRLHTNNVVHGESLNKSSVKPLQFTDKSQSPAAFLPVLQPIFPKPLSEWTATSTQSEVEKHNRLDKVSRGSRRWTALPIRVPTSTELQLSIRPIDLLEDNLCPSNDCRKQEEETIHHDNKTKQLLRVFSELISAWKIFVQPNDLQLTKAMTSMSSQCASQQMYGLEIVCQLLFRSMAASSLNKDGVISLKHEEIWRKVECLLEAETERVRILSAILLCCYNKDLANKKMTDTLLSSLDSLSYSEKWSATQTLAITGTCNIDIVAILFDHLCRHTLSDCDKERISTLLTKLSNDSTLIVSVLAEKLNSRCWKERHTSCSLFPLLCHPLNKDVSYRLLHCTLHDWNPQVRLMAAQALGKTGNGKLVHDAIKEDITNNNELTKLNALKKIHLLHMMTATILPLYVQCFKDDHDSIKLEVISIAEDLGLMDDDVMSALTLLLQDKCWKVKAHAIKAVGTLKYTSERVISHLLWAARFEQLPVMRAQVCHTLAILGNKDERIVTALKDLLNVEDNVMVLREARKSLHTLGQDSIAVDGMLDIVCAEVKSLSTKERITKQILSAEKKQMVEYVMMKHN